MRFLHTMLRVGNLERSIQFYTQVMGMYVIRQKDYPEGKFTLVFLGYGNENEQHCLELTYNWDKTSYDLGDGFGHIAIGCNDIYGLCHEIGKKGGVVSRAPGPMKHGQTVIAFVEDPDGYKIELIDK